MKPTKIKVTLTKNKIFIFDAYLSFLLWTCVVLLFPLIALIKEKVMPRYFFLDANTIENFMLRKTPLTPGDSYASTAAFYNFFGVERDSFFFPLIASVIIIYFFFIVMKRAMPGKLSLIEFGTYLYYILLAIVYMSLLSKDFIVMLILLPFMFFAKKGIPGLLVWSLFACFYAVYFRSYWFLILAIFWGFYFIFRFVSKPQTIFLLVFLGLFVLAIVFNIVMGVDVDNFRTIVNDVRLDANQQGADSMITSIIPGGGFIIGWINVSLTWLFLMLPVPLILALSPYYMVISFFLIFLYYKFWQATKTELTYRRDPVLKAVICLIVAFTAIQSVFEPDYGSYVRHLAPFYPLFFYAVFSTTWLRERADIQDDENEDITLR
ncbi:hypothetical protein ED28_14800 [[Pantoea] beijingensis]|uniref:Uncharacterized protein n=1 Tax=[Pantoea] beijingensis TaxID=1324864 RepID=A0A443IBA7_9GAMM|nr:hypothetical protein [[Pantoea] beijingensis]RWR01187.1 hypothetical protein ED28_14800 [[Pantoea] beijingensis]